MVMIIEPRDVPLGGIRAMNVRRTLPQRARTTIGAWCFLDHYGPDDVSVTGGMDVPAHPHIGLQTVSWLFSGEIEHRDSAGYHEFVRPGEMNLMTAGAGISHSERSTPDTSTLHGVQLWVVLPDESRKTEKRFEHYVPDVITGEGWSAQVFLGSLLGEASPVKTFSALVGAEFNIEPGVSFSFEVNPEFEHGVLVDSGEVLLQTGGRALEQRVLKDELAFIDTGVSHLTVVAGDERVRLIFIGGAPFGEEIVMWWNFIARDHDEIVQAQQDWKAQLEGAEPGRYGLPNNEPSPPLPAPPLPIARLKPRQQK